MTETKRDEEPAFKEGFDRELFLGQLYCHLLSLHDLMRTLAASGIADNDRTPFGSLRVHLSYLAPVLRARCEELTARLTPPAKGVTSAAAKVDPQILAALSRSTQQGR